MNGIQILKDLAQRSADVAHRLSEVESDRLNAHPGHDNSIAWLLWHAAREIDEQLADLSGNEPVWTAQGYDRRFGLDVEPHELGFGHTPEQARGIVVEHVGLLIEHLDDVVAALQAYLDTLEDADLDAVVDENWDPPVTRGARLVSIAGDALQHVGQAMYVAGMADSAFEG